VIPGPSRVLVVVAHPDDEVLGVGGTIRRWVNEGARVDVLVATDGSSAQFGSDLHSRQRRTAHMYTACGILGVANVTVLEFPDMRLDTVPHIELNRSIAAVVDASRHDTVLTHHPGDVNLDHAHVFNSVMVAARPQPNCAVRTVATFAMAAYEDEVREWPHPRSLRAVRSRAEVHGSEVGVPYAEPLFLVRTVLHLG